jgi:hypothetical protein
MPENPSKISLQKIPNATMERRLERLERHAAKSSADFDAVKGSLAANTSMTKEVADGQIALAAVLAKIDVEKIIKLVDAVESMKGGVKVLGWLERPAKWVATMAAAFAVFYSIWESRK